MFIGPMPADYEFAYRVEAIFRFPLTEIPATVVGERSVYTTRIDPQESWYDGILFALSKYPYPEWVPGDDLVRGVNTELASLKTLVKARTIPEAAERARGPMYLALDDLAFQLQWPLVIERLDIINITSPVTSGDLREAGSFSGFDHARNQRSTGNGEFSTALKPIMRNLNSSSEQKVADAMDWYMKGLAATNDADRYIFFWVCFEIIVKLGEGVQKYTPQGLAGCHHKLTECPRCHKSALRYNQRETNTAVMRAYGLTDPKEADRLWRMRHIVHGSYHFTPGQSQELYECMTMIRRICFRAIKLMTRWHVESAPLDTGKGMSFHQGIGAIMTRAVRPWDMYQLAPKGVKIDDHDPRTGISTVDSDKIEVDPPSGN
jgi:hypothetical protein